MVGEGDECFGWVVVDEFYVEDIGVGEGGGEVGVEVGGINGGGVGVLRKGDVSMIGLIDIVGC